MEETNAHKLLRIFNEELKAYKDLLKLASQKTEVLINADVNILDEITQVEQSIVIELGKLEEQRNKILNESFKESPEKNLNARSIADKLPKEQSGIFSRTCEEMKAVLKELEEKNKINERLIKKALDYINFSINVLTDVGQVNPSYSSDGQSHKQRAYNIIDKKA